MKSEEFVFLKPLYDKAKNALESITEDDIRRIVLSEVEHRVSDMVADAINLSRMDEIIENWVDDNEDRICNAVKESLMRKLSLKDYRFWL